MSTPIAEQLERAAACIERHWTEAWIENAWHDQQISSPYRAVLCVDRWHREYGLRRSSYSLNGYLWVIELVGREIIHVAEEMTISGLIEEDGDRRYPIGVEDRVDDFRGNLRALCQGTLRDLLTQGLPDGSCSDRYWDGVLAHPQLLRGWTEATTQILAWLDANPIAKAA